MEAIVSGFVSGNPASQIAEETGLNLKTVHLYYGRIRELIAADRERYLRRSYGSSEISPNLFVATGISEKRRNAVLIGCLIHQESEMELLLTNETADGEHARLDPSSVAGWIIAADRKALDELQLDRINCLPGNSAREKARVFWKNTKNRLSSYCGGFKNHFRLYLREMEFKNNIKNMEAARQQITELLVQSPSKTTGEEDA
ncbi:MAG: hypothetical protein C0623_02020 [Desulfuromonas sp.]|nr:MAG: hypothetical protein C0623_02020 [Desulfuromonas sp.]